MFGRISNTWAIMGACWRVLKKDKELLLFSLLSFVCCAVVLASFAIPIVLTESWAPPGGETATTASQVAYYGMLFLFYFANFFVITFFNSAIVACAIMRMHGQDPTFGDGIKAALERVHLILGWALLAATVSLILRFIEDRSPKVGRFIAGLLGMAWTLTTFLVVPIMVVKKKGPFGALKESAGLFRRTWGEQVIGNFSFGVLFFLLSIPGILLVVLGFLSGSVAGLAICIGCAVIYLMVLALVQSALQVIFQAAVYVYAADGKAPAEFSNAMLRNAVGPRA